MLSHHLLNEQHCVYRCWSSLTVEVCRSASKALQGMRRLHWFLTSNYMEYVQGQVLIYKETMASLQRYILREALLCIFRTVMHPLGLYPTRIEVLAPELLGSWQLPKSAGCDWWIYAKAIAHSRAVDTSWSWQDLAATLLSLIWGSA